MGRLSRIVQWVQHDHNISYKRDVGGDREEGSVMTEAATGKMNFEGGQRGYKPRNAGGHQKLRKARKRISPQSLWKEPALLTSSIN